MNMILIDYPLKYNEAEIEAMLWYALRRNGIDARLQIKSNHSKLDIVVFVNNWPVCIIECKSWSESYAKTVNYRRGRIQIERYKDTFRMPVIVCGDVKQIDDVVQKVKGVIAKQPLREKKVIEFDEIPF